MRPPVAELRRRAGRVAERPVERRAVLRRVRHDRGVLEAALVERLPDGADAAVHHVRRRDDVGAGRGVRDRGAHQLIDRRIVRDLVVDHDAAVSVVGVLAQADVGDDEHVGHLALDRADRRLHRRLGIVGRRPDVVLAGRAGRRAARSGRRRARAAAASLTASSTDRLNTPGIDGTSRRTPSPSQTNSGSTNMSGDSRVSRTSARIASDAPQPAQPARQRQRACGVDVRHGVDRRCASLASRSRVASRKCSDDASTSAGTV